MKQIITTLLLLLFLTTTASAEFGVKFQSQPNLMPPITKKLLISAQFQIQFNDLDDDGAPDIVFMENDTTFGVMSGRSKEILWQQQISTIVNGGHSWPKVSRAIGFIRSPSLGGPAVVIATALNASESGIIVIDSSNDQIILADGSVQLLAIADPDRDNFADLILYRPEDGVFLVAGERHADSTAAHLSPRNLSGLPTHSIGSDYQLALKFESQPGRNLAFDSGLIHSPGKFDADGDGAMDLVMMIRDGNGNPIGLRVRHGSGSHRVKWQFAFPEEHRDNIVSAFHGFFDVDGNGVKEVIVGTNLAVTADRTVHVIDEKLEIVAVLDLNRDGFPEIIGNNTADSTVQVWGKGTTTSVSEEDLIIAGFQLEQNYPNPFNPSTTINYSLERASEVDLKIYDLLGREVRSLVNENKSRGEFSVVWDGKDDTGNRVASGNFFYRLKAGEFLSTRRMILLK